MRCLTRPIYSGLRGLEQATTRATTATATEHAANGVCLTNIEGLIARLAILLAPRIDFRVCTSIAVHCAGGRFGIERQTLPSSLGQVLSKDLTLWRVMTSLYIHKQMRNK